MTSQNNDLAFIKAPRFFPFKAGTGFKPADKEKADKALRVFEILLRAVNAGALAESDLKDVFFKSISDSITYRESWKCGKFWSVAAWRRAVENGHTNGLVSEHVLPRGAALSHSLTLPLEEAKEFIWHSSFECVVTQEEDKLLNGKGLKSAGNADNPWVRYQIAGINILDVEHPKGTKFLDDAERSLLQKLGILSPHEASECNCQYCIRQVSKIYSA